MQIPTSRVIEQYGLDRLARAALLHKRSVALVNTQDKRLPLGARRHWAAVVAACDHFLQGE